MVIVILVELALFKSTAAGEVEQVAAAGVADGAGAQGCGLVERAQVEFELVLGHSLLLLEGLSVGSVRVGVVAEGRGAVRVVILLPDLLEVYCSA